MSEPTADTRRTTRHGLSLLAWLIVFGLLLTAAVDRIGLKYVQGVIWPTDLHTFGLQDGPRQIDVAILGSSRASFDLTPSVIDACLSGKLSRPTHTVNLARVFATGHTMLPVYDDLLAADPPKLMVIGVTPEALDDTNPMMATSVGSAAGVGDMPKELVGARSMLEVVSSLRPLARGAETLPFFLAGRHSEEARLKWIMHHHGGGQWCSGSPACDAQNADLERVLSLRWTQAERGMLPNVRAQRFGDYNARSGRARQAFIALIDRAQADDVEVVLMELPLHRAFTDEIPPEVIEEYEDVLSELVRTRGLTLYQPDVDSWTSDKRHWIDPDHLGRRASAELSRMLCRDVLAGALDPS